ncbi:hypothetical protein Acy02nite_69350 [Actinoplanes cyaneus]|uniref:Uncharacterized protein n=1 Tax=Actinoplanes cyaneus TaxID=52696 RepID=A0A919INT6_9ACTN|nr:hypothetical protein [Actinoplanes cyaneus]MCW2139017.1 hypothetical protein [Actinoplanes cyaneus]GID69054.1 hypothetical protein Acy02nite_69350 [Actinoplanes cyaneus]
MAGWRVERTPRAASGSVPATHGGSPLMPPHSQGAERRPERRAGRAGHRWFLRVLVISGLAGVAWLLTGAAANAAEPDAEPVSGSAPGIVLDDAVEPATTWFDVSRVHAAGELLKAAVQPLESEPKPHQRVLTMHLDPAEEPAGDAVTDAEPVNDAEPSGDALRTAPAPLRASSGDADDQELPAAGGELPVRAPAVAATTLPPAAEQPGQPAVTGTAGEAAALAGTRTALVPARHATDGAAPARRVRSHARSYVHRHAPAARPVAPRTLREPETIREPEEIRDDVPGGDGSAPARMNLGAVSGIPAGGSGANTESGSSAVLPSGIANGPVACHRCPIAPDVDARRHDAEAPTVSPD